MKEAVYLDTTVLSFCFDQRESVRYLAEITQQWWREEHGKYDVFLSAETLAELGHGEYPRKEEILALAVTQQSLQFTPEIVEIAEGYMANALMPRELGGDAVHLAYASFYRIDYLLTWNCNHLANANKKRHIRIINSRMQLFTPEIVTPLELFTER